jgi:septum formation protein
MLFLASQSPRRRELLNQLGVEFQVVAGPDIDESAFGRESPRDYVERMVREKCAAVLAREPLRSGDCILVADTTVTFDDHILGKPESREDAIRMLTMLSGRSHQVITGLAVATNSQMLSTLHITDVTFAAIDRVQIERYTDSGEPLDKAGAYGIQGRAAAFISRIDGSFSSVMGLPLFETAQLLKQIGVTR